MYDRYRICRRPADRLFEPQSRTRPAPRLTWASGSQVRRHRGFSLLELVVVIGTITYLLALLLPALQNARRSALQTRCALNLRQIGTAIQAYANDNDLFVPRDCTPGRPDRAPWLVLLGPYVFGDRELTVNNLHEVKTYQCPAHPMTQLQIPSGYVINAFAFETGPNWSPDGPIKLTMVRGSATLPWVLEATNGFPGSAPGVADPIFLVEFHDVYDPAHLPQGDLPRITDQRHGKRSNVLYLDGHVAAVTRGELTLQQFDDRAVHRATTAPATDAGS
jgi:prepilin-type processing-associated H-X9-DG protein